VTKHHEELDEMAHHEEQPTAIENVLEVLSEHGLGAMAEAMQTLLNEAMKLERSEFLRAAPGERTDARTGYANGFKDKALRTRVGELALRIPQVRPLPAARRSASIRARWSAGCAASGRSGYIGAGSTSRPDLRKRALTGFGQEW
jgi:hypothetical protein